MSGESLLVSCCGAAVVLVTVAFLWAVYCYLESITDARDVRANVLRDEIASLEKSLQFHVDDHNSVIEHNFKLRRRFNDFRRETEQRVEQIRVLLREIVDLSTEEDFNDDEEHF